MSIQFIQPPGGEKIAVVSMHITNSQVLLHRSIEVLAITSKKIVLNKGVYTVKELNSLIGMELKSQMLDSRNDVLRTNKLEGITKMIISLNELDNSDNLEDGRPSNVLFTYYVQVLNIMRFSNLKQPDIGNSNMARLFP